MQFVKMELLKERGVYNSFEVLESTSTSGLKKYKKFIFFLFLIGKENYLLNMYCYSAIFTINILNPV